MATTCFVTAFESGIRTVKLFDHKILLCSCGTRKNVLETTSKIKIRKKMNDPFSLKLSERELSIPIRSPRAERIDLSSVVPSSTLPIFLRRFPDRPYITILTRRHRNAVPALDLQVERLLLSTRLILRSVTPPTNAALRSVLLRAIPVLAERVPQDDNNPSEMRMVVVLDQKNLSIHAAPVLQPDSVFRYPASVTVEVRGLPRHQPMAKNTRWVTDRFPLETSRQPSHTETILHLDGALYEGLTTNFYVVIDACTIMTAPENTVYPGTMRTVVLQACDHLGIKVILIPPKISNWSSFQSAFITNAARMLVPVTSIFFTNDTADFTDVPNPLILHEDPIAMCLINRLRECVDKLLDNSNTLVTPHKEI